MYTHLYHYSIKKGEPVLLLSFERFELLVDLN